MIVMREILNVKHTQAHPGDPSQALIGSGDAAPVPGRCASSRRSLASVVQCDDLKRAGMYSNASDLSSPSERSVSSQYPLVRSANPAVTIHSGTPSMRIRLRLSAVSRTSRANAYSGERYHARACSKFGNSTITIMLATPRRT
jgi:hypothetical protein